jgi:acetyltransferase-like isoleucine patch superfamily enzyme
MMEALVKNSNRHLEFIAPRAVVIEENVWIGFEAVVLPGITIGRGAVIGCKTVVTENVPPYAVVAGNPARIIRFIEPTDTEEAKEKAFKKFLKD